MSEVTKRVYLQSCDGELYEIDNDVVSMCATVKNMLKGKSAFRNSLGGQFSVDGSYVILKKEGRVLASLTKNNEEEAIVTLPDVKAGILEKVIEYCKFHNSAVATVSQRERKAWDTEFVLVKQGVLCELASASYYLDIKQLVNLTSRAIASQISASSVATRCRLQRKFNRKKQDDKDLKDAGSIDDNRSVEELLEFLGDSDKQKSLTSSSSQISNSTKKKSKKKKKDKKKDKSNSLKEGEEEYEEEDDTITNDGILSEEITNSIRKSLLQQYEQESNSSPSLSRDEKQDHGSSSSRSSSGSETPGEAESPDGEGEVFWSEDDDLDPKQRADLDKEVEEFRQRLESMNTDNGAQKPKIPLPVSASSILSSLVGVGVH